MPWLVDGNNAGGGVNRGRVREAALAIARRERLRILVVFDGAPPAGVPNVERLGSVEVRYATDADQEIMAVLQGRGTGWRVVTDDRALAFRARATGAEVVPTGDFWRKAEPALRKAGPSSGRLDVEDELAFFRDPANRLPPTPRRLRRKKR